MRKSPARGYPDRALGGGNEGKEENFIPLDHHCDNLNTIF
jgi:hypothetical protein